MIKNSSFAVFLGSLLCFFAPFFHAQQLQPGELVDGIAAVVGDEIVLESDIRDQANYAKQQGNNVADKCQFLEGIVNNKLLIYAAKKDTLIEKRTVAIKEGVDAKYQQILAQFPDEKTMLATYKFRTAFEMRTAIEKIDTDSYYGQAKYQRITDKTDVSPSEVTDFFNQNKAQLPQVKDEVTIAQIVTYPKLTEVHKNELIAKLKKIKQDIQNGQSFEEAARIYSEDKGSAKNGGLYANISRGKMVKSFEATALNLQEGEISDPVESEYGFHIIQLVKKSGKNYDARHILLLSEPTTQELTTAKKLLDSVRTQIMEGKITFKDAAYKYSEDKRTKFNGGIIANADGGDKIEKLELPALIAYQLAGLNKGDITTAYTDDSTERKSVNILKYVDIIPEHQLDITTDYDRIKQLALNRKKNEVVQKWVGEQLPKTFISIDNRYKDCTFKTNWNKNAMTK